MFKRFRDALYTFGYKRFTTSLVPKGFTTFFTISKRIGRNSFRHNLYCPGKESVKGRSLRYYRAWIIFATLEMHVPLEITVI